MAASIILTVLGAVFLTLFCLVRDENSSVKALLLKTLTSVCFVLAGLFGISNGAALPAGALIVSGLLFGLIGDVLLDLKFIDKPNADMYTYGGMGSFLVGHIFYITALFLVFDLTVGGSLISAGITLVLAAAVVVTTLKVMKYDYGKFLVPAAIYSVLLIFFTVLSVYALIRVGGTAAVLFTIGSVLFLLSDVILSMTYFGGKKGLVYLVTNHTTYYAAQFLIALAVCFIPVLG
ncbi:MAG: lysoplasmalogenase [Clostridiales bacterium]|jgi:uncharacterized membrane protein YhhN|nr:lysoplasmalogenase [Clostridiales bacterium]